MSDYDTDSKPGADYSYTDYLESGEVSGSDYSSDDGTDLNSSLTEWSPNSDYTNSEIEGSMTDSTGEDLNKYSKEKDDNGDTVLENFEESTWNELSSEKQKESITELANYVATDTGNEKPPEIVFRNDMEEGSYGGYNPGTNTLEINENMLGDSAEAADTVAHEMWHAHQQQCALDPTNEKGREYQEGFDNYISPEYDFEGYENQMVEAEAREYAQGFKDKLAGMKGAA